MANGRFKGGWITRHYGRPEAGVHAGQMELACRSYMEEPIGPVDEANWPAACNPAAAEPVREALRRILRACLEWVTRQA